jgi:hypothetical protein
MTAGRSTTPAPADRALPGELGRERLDARLQALLGEFGRERRDARLEGGDAIAQFFSEGTNYITYSFT